MALGSRELLLVMRASNQMSGTLTRVAGELEGLGTTSELTSKKMMTIGAGITAMGVGIAAVGVAGFAVLNKAADDAMEYEK